MLPKCCCLHLMAAAVNEAVLETLRKQGRPPRKTWTFDSVPGEVPGERCQSSGCQDLPGLCETF